jgi:2-polyprenyl-3-methyl-5-hydroxy-6-metoxy-1,4-benzoquinol methylase
MKLFQRRSESLANFADRITQELAETQAQLATFHDRMEGLQHSVNFLNLERLLDSAFEKTPDELFRGVSDDYWLWVNTQAYRASTDLRKILPGLPKNKDLEFAVVTLKGEENLTQGFEVYQHLKRLHETYQGGLTSCGAILDFGCGWGRIVRFFLRDVKPAVLWGTDPWKECIEAAKETNHWCHFEVNNPMPPTSFPSNMFDFIYSYSVFSHFSEESHKEWLREIHRLLKPGGLFIATTMPRSHLDWIAGLQKAGSDADAEDLDRIAVNREAATLFPQPEKFLADYDDGRYCYSSFADYQVAGMPWGDACIPKAYVLTHWSEYFSVLDFIDDLCSQAWIITKRNT